MILCPINHLIPNIDDSGFAFTAFSNCCFEADAYILCKSLPKIYAKPSLDMIKNAMNKANPELNNEKPIWLENEDDLARICGLR